MDGLSICMNYQNLVIKMDSDSNSIHELLELFKHFKSAGAESKHKDMSSLSFSDKNYDSSQRNPIDSMTTISRHHCQSLANSTQNRTNTSIFERLYQQSKEKEERKCRLEYETRKSKEERQREQCTFSPNICSRKRPLLEYDSVEKNQSFYLKNMEWLERKDKSIKKLQVEKNQKNINELTFTPRINKDFKRANKDQKGKPGQEREGKENQQVQGKRGVPDFLSRQQKAKKMKQYVAERKKNPYSHIWNMKKGYFSYVK